MNTKGTLAVAPAKSTRDLAARRRLSYFPEREGCVLSVWAICLCFHDAIRPSVSDEPESMVGRRER